MIYPEPDVSDAASEDGPKNVRLLCKKCYFTLEGKYMN
jgi:hypothetical protein